MPVGHRAAFAAIVFFALPSLAAAQERYTGPIIDMHLHAAEEVNSPLRPCKPYPCERQPTQAESGEEIRTMTLAAMERNNIVLGVLSDLPERVFEWTEGDDRFLTGIWIIQPDQEPINELREMFESGRAQVLGEIGSQYAGIPIDDPSLEPLFALADELYLPVHVHVMGGGGSPDFPIDLGNPLRLTHVLQKHPGLRIQVENSGWPFLEEVTALMYQFPTVNGDISTILSARPPEVALRYVRGLVENGLGKRIMFGSDQMIWPETIDIAVEVLQSAHFLTVEQKADIFYNNAARYLNLSDEVIARHHRMVAERQ
jgi:predicted TIM-barrel fold metal-dependent hydrolase